MPQTANANGHLAQGIMCLKPPRPAAADDIVNSWLFRLFRITGYQPYRLYDGTGTIFIAYVEGKLNTPTRQPPTVETKLRGSTAVGRCHCEETGSGNTAS